MFKLLHGDCMKLLPTIEQVDLVLCDMPYGKTSCYWDKSLPLKNIWLLLDKIIKDDTCVIFTSKQPFTSHLILSNLSMFKYELIWEKERPTNFMLLKKRIGDVHESILVFYKTQPTYNPVMEPSIQQHNNSNNISQIGPMNNLQHMKFSSEIGKDYNPKLRYPRSVIKIPRGTRKNKKLHPTQKPIALMEYLIKTYSNENDTVLDFCMGSGTTGVACKNLKRNFIGIEKEKHYFELAKDRICMTH